MALDWLERSLEQHDPNLPYLGVWGWEEFYEYPRFQAVIKEIGVPPSVGHAQGSLGSGHPGTVLRPGVGPTE